MDYSLHIINTLWPKVLTANLFNTHRLSLRAGAVLLIQFCFVQTSDYIVGGGVRACYASISPLTEVSEGGKMCSAHYILVCVRVCMCAFLMFGHVNLI